MNADEPTDFSPFSPFSHAPSAPEVHDATPHGPMVLQAHVRAPVDAAFSAVTDAVHLWWPLADVSAFGADSSLEFEDETLLETGPDDDVSAWARVRSWQQDHFIELEWSPDAPVLTARTVLLAVADASVTPASDSTRGSAVDDGSTVLWTIEDGAPVEDWSTVFDRYVRFLGGRVD